jgi:hypothetical protein
MRRSRIIPRRRGRPAPRGRGPQGPSRGRPTSLRGPQGPRSRATSRPTVNPGQGLKNFMDTMPRAPRAGGPQGPRGAYGRNGLAQRNAMQRQLEAAARSQAGRGSLFGTMGNVAQRPIPNRDGRMAQMQADLARAARANMGSMGQGMRGPQGPRPMPPSNYMRQIMPAQQMQRGMGRGPMQRANIGQIQASRPTFGQQMRPKAPGQRLNRRRFMR